MLPQSKSLFSPLRRTTLQLCVACAFAGTVQAQAPTLHQLVTPSATFESTLISIDQVRELPTGGALILDRLVGNVHFADAAWRSSVQTGRTGAGPGEYRDVSQLIPISNSRTLAVHTTGSRGVVFDRGGEPAGEWEAPAWMRNCANRSRPLQGVRFADASDRLYAEAAPIRVDRSGRRQVADAAAIERTRASCERDTVDLIESWHAMLVRGGTVIGNLPVGRPGTYRPPFQGNAQWAVFPDGRVAVVRPEPFTFESIASNGQRRSVRLPHVPVPVTAAHKEAWRTHMTRPVRVVMASRSGVGGVQIARQPAPPEPTAWPRFLPPFPDDALHAGADGKLWIRRSVAADAPALYDVVDAAGALVHRVTLRPRSRLVGVGARFAYVVRIDDDDVEHVERYQLPW